MLASFGHLGETTWWSFFMTLGIAFGPAIAAALLGVRGGSPGTKGGIAFMASMLGIVVTVLLFCFWPRKIDIGLWAIVIAIAGGALGSFVLARVLAR